MLFPNNRCYRSNINTKHYEPRNFLINKGGKPRRFGTSDSQSAGGHFCIFIAIEGFSDLTKIITLDQILI